MFLFFIKYVIIPLIDITRLENNMKKTLLVIAILIITVTAAATLLVACSNVNQVNMASMGWLDYERYTYNVYETVGETKNLIGTMTYTFKRIDGDVEINGKTFNESNGAFVTMNLQIFDGEYKDTTLESTVVFNSTFNPKASFKKYVCSDNSLSYTTFIDYSTSGKHGSFVYTDGNGQTTEKSFGKSARYDNDSIYTLIRASVFSTKNYGLSVYVNDKATCERRSVSVSMVSNEKKITTDYENTEFTCTQIATTLSSTGTSGTLDVALRSNTHFLYFSNTPIKVDGKDIVKPLVEIQEGDYSYVLASVSITEE